MKSDELRKRILELEREINEISKDRDGWVKDCDALEQELTDTCDDLQTARTALHAAYAENLELRTALDLTTPVRSNVSRRHPDQGPGFLEEVRAEAGGEAGSTGDQMKKRARTDADKQEICMRLLVAWSKSPYERLGQFLSNVTEVDLFYVEDFPLIEAAELRVTKQET